VTGFEISGGRFFSFFAGFFGWPVRLEF